MAGGLMPIPSSWPINGELHRLMTLEPRLVGSFEGWRILGTGRGGRGAMIFGLDRVSHQKRCLFHVLVMCQRVLKLMWVPLSGFPGDAAPRRHSPSTLRRLGD